jgi:hypothetical protein
MLIPRVNVTVQARYQPLGVQFEICCENSGNGKSLPRETLSSLRRTIRGTYNGPVRLRTEQYNKNLLQELTVVHLVKEYSSFHYALTDTRLRQAKMDLFRNPLNPKTQL